MDLDYFILGLAIFLVGFVFGWLNHAKLIFDKLVENPEAILKLAERARKSKQDQPNLKTKTPVHEIEVDFQNGVYYLYNKSTGQFLAQADTLSTALELVSTRFPGEQFSGHIPKEQADAWGVTKEVEQTK